MRLKHIKDADKIVERSVYSVNEPNNYKGKWKKIFSNNNDIEIEIGCGRGNFIINKALENKNINYIGIEKYDSALVKAIKRLENININNLKFIVCDANNIENIFDKEITKIYLNFSDPWPKKRHIKRRLTFKSFLEKYDKVFFNKKIIEMKTDNDDLFDYSLISFDEYGYKIVEINRNYVSKITTEYEDKFIKKGKNINYVKVEYDK